MEWTVLRGEGAKYCLNYRAKPRSVAETPTPTPPLSAALGRNDGLRCWFIASHNVQVYEFTTWYGENSLNGEVAVTGYRAMKTVCITHKQKQLGMQGSGRSWFPLSTKFRGAFGLAHLWTFRLVHNVSAPLSHDTLSFPRKKATFLIKPLNLRIRLLLRVPGSVLSSDTCCS
jgi:hypothetical protein